jgi:hypothetical protein
MAMNKTSAHWGLILLTGLMLGCSAGPTHPIDTRSTVDSTLPAPQSVPESGRTYSVQQYGYTFEDAATRCRRICSAVGGGWYNYRRCFRGCITGRR